MKCPLEGTIQAYIDGELEPDESFLVKEHIKNCDNCKQVYEILNENNIFLENKIHQYKESVQEVVIPPPLNFNQKPHRHGEGVINNMLKNKKLYGGLCAAVVLTLCLTVQPVRTAIASALSIFRVENVKSISMSLKDMNKIQREITSHKGDIDMDKFGKMSITGGNTKDISFDELTKTTDLKVLFPSSVSGISSMRDTSPAKITFDLNVENVNTFMQSLGAKKLLPSELNGKAFSINVPRVIDYNFNYKGTKINVMETKTPELIVPDGVNMDEIYNSLIELPILPDDLQRQLRSIKDWKNTLYIPVDGATMQEVTINGAKGYTGYTIPDDKTKGEKISHLIFFKDGVFYELDGNIDKTELIDIAKSMR